MKAQNGFDQMKYYGKTFYLASRFLTKKHAHSASQLYAICRTIDDIADLTADPDHARERLKSLYESVQIEDRQDPLVAAFLDIRPAVQLAPLLDLITGVLSDLDRVRIQTAAELQLYAYRVAGTVGLMMCDVLGVTDSVARSHATDLGVAMQMTNIARDVLEDARADRRYLPGDWVTDINPKEILAPTETQRLSIQDAVLDLLHWAEDLYESGLRGLPALPFRARLGVLVAAKVYREIGICLIKNKCDVWGVRTVVPNSRKITLCLHTIVNFNARPTLDKRPFEKQPRLQQNMHRTT